MSSTIRIVVMLDDLLFGYSNRGPSLELNIPIVGTAIGRYAYWASWPALKALYCISAKMSNMGLLYILSWCLVNYELDGTRTVPVVLERRYVQMRTGFRFPVLMVVLVSLLSATAERSTVVPFTGPDLSTKPLHFILVQHAQCAQDQFWCPVEQGIQDAARDLGVTATVLGPDALDLKQMTTQIDEAVAAKPDGIALTVSDPAILLDPILRALPSGIPIIAYNAGSGPTKDSLPYLTYLGMDDYQGGYVGAHRLLSAGAHGGVCVIDAPELSALQLRCKGFRDAFAEQGQPAEILTTVKDASEAQSAIQTFAEGHPEINAYLTSELSIAVPFYSYLRSTRSKSIEILT